MIVSAGGIDHSTLVNALRQAEVDEGWIITHNAGESLIGESDPDFVTAVFNPTADVVTPDSVGGIPFTNLDVAMRAGRAAGQGYPVLLVVPPPMQVPADLPGVVVASCPLDDRETLRLHIWAFVSTLPVTDRLAPQLALSQPTDFDASRVLDQLQRIDSTQDVPAMKVERLVASLLSQVGAELVEKQDATEPNNQVDLAFLPSRDASDVVLVEVKAGRRLTERRLTEAEEQLQQYVIERRASLGLLLYHDFGGKHLPVKHATPLVIRMSVQELVAGLEIYSLPDLLRGVVKDTIRRM